jgi:hypothetical protein
MLSNEHQVRTDYLAGTLHKFTSSFETGRCYRNASEENTNEPANSWRRFERERASHHNAGDGSCHSKVRRKAAIVKQTRTSLRGRGRRQGVGAVKQKPESFREGDGN